MKPSKKITNITLKWQHYLEFDEEGEFTDSKVFVPVEIILTLDSGEFLHLALIKFGVNIDPFEIKAPEYDLNGEMLVSLNNKLEIAEPSTEE